MSPAEVRKRYSKIIQPPHEYYDLQNAKRSSSFPPGEPSSFYQPFIEYFEERAQTCRAQARLDAKKGNAERSMRYRSLAAGWAEGARVARMRQERSFLDEQLEAAKHAIG